MNSYRPPLQSFGSSSCQLAEMFMTRTARPVRLTDNTQLHDYSEAVRL